MYKPKGGLPSFARMRPDLVGSHLTDHTVWGRMHDMTDGELITDDDILEGIALSYPDLMFGEISLIRVNHSQRFIPADPSSPFNLYIPYNCNTECTLYIHKTLMDMRRLAQFETWFINGHHLISFDRSFLRDDKLILKVVCDERIREALDGFERQL